MIGRDRTARGGRPLLVLISLIVILSLPGCSDLRQAIGLDQTGPDEFAVESRAPLTIPPDFNLRPPEPGAPRPQEVTAAQKAQKLIDTAGPGQPGKQESGTLRVPAGGIAGAAGPDISREVAGNSLAAKLLSSGDTAGGTAAARKTTPLQGVY
jgi:Protein of unknown function (DUF3035)